MAVDALRKAFALLGTNIESLASGDAGKILSAGLDVKATKTPAGIPAQVMSLSLTAGDHDGELKAQWDRVAGAKTYEVQVCPDPVSPTGWTKAAKSTKSSVVLTGLTSGQRVWVRVCATGSAGDGNWSDPGHEDRALSPKAEG